MTDESDGTCMDTRILSVRIFLLFQKILYLLKIRNAGHVIKYPYGYDLTHVLLTSSMSDLSLRFYHFGDFLYRSCILREVQARGNTKLPSNKSVLVLGDNGSGKTTLVAKLQGVEDPTKGSGLEYAYIDVRDEYRDGKDCSVFY